MRVKQINDQLATCNLRNIDKVWLQQCMEYLHDSPNQFEDIRTQILFGDLADMISRSELPVGKDAYHIAEPVLLQVLAVREIGCSQQHMLDALAAGKSLPRKMLKITMTDGVRVLAAIESSPVPALSITMEIGLKFLIRNTPVKRDVALLHKDSVEILGGSIADLNPVAPLVRLERETRKNLGLAEQSSKMHGAMSFISQTDPNTDPEFDDLDDAALQEISAIEAQESQHIESKQEHVIDSSMRNLAESTVHVKESIPEQGPLPKRPRQICKISNIASQPYTKLMQPRRYCVYQLRSGFMDQANGQQQHRVLDDGSRSITRRARYSMRPFKQRLYIQYHRYGCVNVQIKSWDSSWQKSNDGGGLDLY